jgi:acetyl esterase/lipase
VPVELHVYPGVPHMFDQHPGALTDQAQRDTLRALQAIFCST